MGHSKESTKREVHSHTGLPKKDRNISINNLAMQLQELEVKQQIKPRASKRKEITKIRAEVNNIETKGKLKRSMNPGAGS